MPILVGVAAVTQHKLDGRPDATGLTVGVGKVTVELDGLQLDLYRPPALIHEVLLQGRFGVPRRREGSLHGFGVLLPADDPAGQCQHEVIAVVAEGGEAVLRQLPLHRER